MQHGASFDSCFEMSTIEEEQSGDGYNQSPSKKYCGEPYDIVPDMPEVHPRFV